MATVGRDGRGRYGNATPSGNLTLGTKRDGANEVKGKEGGAGTNAGTFGMRARARRGNEGELLEEADACRRHDVWRSAQAHALCKTPV